MLLGQSVNFWTDCFSSSSQHVFWLITTSNKCNKQLSDWPRMYTIFSILKYLIFPLSYFTTVCVWTWMIWRVASSCKRLLLTSLSKGNYSSSIKKNMSRWWEKWVAEWSATYRATLLSKVMNANRNYRNI